MPKTKESYKIPILVLILVILLLLFFNYEKLNQKKVGDYPPTTSQLMYPENYPENYVWMNIESCVNDKIYSHVSLTLYNYYNSAWKSKFLINGIEVPFELNSDNSQNDSAFYNYKILKNDAINITLFLNETYFINYSKECSDLTKYKMLR